jgi:hypothetical protein
VNATAEIEIPDGAEERILLAEKLLSRQVERDNLSWIGPGKCHFAGTSWRPEVRDEEALPRQQLSFQPTENASFHPRIHFDRIGHEHHRAGFRADLVAGAKGEDDRLHVVAYDFVADHEFDPG